MIDLHLKCLRRELGTSTMCKIQLVLSSNLVSEKKNSKLNSEVSKQFNETGTINGQNISGLIAYITQCHLSDPYKITGVW